MLKEDMFEVKGTDVGTLPHSMFRIKLDAGRTINAHRAGRMRI